MSMSDPLLKELKASTFKLVQEIEKNLVITDDCEELVSLCNTLEGIFQKGFYGVCWDWLEQLYNDMETGTIPKSFSYMRAVDTSKSCEKIKTHSGRLRLLIRCCLVNKCLHVPVELVVRVYRNHGGRWYDTKCSILGDEILGEIFLSVALQLSTLYFKLDVTNARFLDNTFILPNCVLVEFVPCTSLGVAVTFVEEKALVMQVDEKSVAAEDNKIQVGDVLDEINGQVIKIELKRKLNNIITKSKCKPISVRLIKLFNGNEDTIYSPIIPLLRKANLDIYDIRRQIFGEGTEADAPVVQRGGPKVKFISSLVIGSDGDVKQIEYAVASVLSNSTLVEPMTVYLECQELGLKVISESTGKILFHHSYMEISSCGQTRKNPNYFAYVAGNNICTLATKFTCYIFCSENDNHIQTILQSIGQGFQRTHFAV